MACKGGGGGVLKLVYSSMNLHPYFGVTHCTLHPLQLQSHLKNSVDTLIHTSLLLLKLIWTTEMSSCLQIIPSDWWLFWKPKSKCFQLSTLFFSRFTCEKSAYKRMGFKSFSSIMMQLFSQEEKYTVTSALKILAKIEFFGEHGIQDWNQAKAAP